MKFLKLKTTLWDDDGYITDMGMEVNGKAVYKLFAKKNQIFYCRELDDTIREMYNVPNDIDDKYIFEEQACEHKWFFGGDELIKQWFEENNYKRR